MQEFLTLQVADWAAFRAGAELNVAASRAEVEVRDLKIFAFPDCFKGLCVKINKVRPLIGHEGCLVAINNALFLPGNELMESVRKLTADGYLEFVEMVSVPQDVTGYAESIVSKSPADPAPFNHPTKIIIMRAYRKDGRRA